MALRGPRGRTTLEGDLGASGEGEGRTGAGGADF
jgi:hypothetical protein